MPDCYKEVFSWVSSVSPDYITHHIPADSAVMSSPFRMCQQICVTYLYTYNCT